MALSDTLTARHRADQDREAAVLAAALELVLERGYDATTLDELARRAKVSKATIYARWKGKPQIVLHALRQEAEISRSITEVDHGSLRADLLAAAAELSADGGRSARLTLALAQAVRADEDVAGGVEEHLTKPQRERNRATLQRAVDRGEVDPSALDIPYALELLGALMVTALLFAPHDPIDAEAFVDRILLPVLTQKSPALPDPRSTP